MGALQLSTVAHPLAVARGLEGAADLGAWLSSDELASLVGLARSTVSGWSSGHSPRPGFELERRKVGPSVWWRVTAEEAGVFVRSPPWLTTEATRRACFGSLWQSTCCAHFPSSTRSHSPHTKHPNHLQVRTTVGKGPDRAAPLPLPSPQLTPDTRTGGHPTIRQLMFPSFPQTRQN